MNKMALIDCERTWLFSAGVITRAVLVIESSISFYLFVSKNMRLAI